ncbi:MAG: hypothetical protein LBS91_03425 [Clostridiales Family XIII bacterium]|jgi:hypothetical protein|nr:hypothetical protein [Clostridiales Family XIII bacterium]
MTAEIESRIKIVGDALCGIPITEFEKGRIVGKLEGIVSQIAAAPEGIGADEPPAPAAMEA